MENVAITGMGVISSLGQDLETFNRNIENGKVVAGPTPWHDQPGYENVWMSLIEDFQPGRWMEDRVVRNSALFSQYAIAAAVQAVEDSGIETFDPLRTAVIIGTALGGVDVDAAGQHNLEAEGPDAVDRKFMVKFLPNMPSAHLALRWGLHGPQMVIATACASSHDAMGTAARMIETGEVDVAITGGTDCGISPLLFFGARNYGMFTPQPDPYKTCRPFNVERFGVMLGEGAGMFVLERADHARKRGATIHGMLRGYATLADGHHPSSPEPEGKWEQLVMEQAIRNANLPGGADQIGAVVAHGTGTPVGDIAELAALNRIYGHRDVPMPITSPKGNFGHPHGPAGALGLLVGLHGMKNNAVMATAGTYDTKDLMPEVGNLRVVINEPAPAHVEAIQVNAFGFGGQNASMVVSKE
ncbi:MAG TPA: beta-ketoacyl-[acyl-carrier-protein] synthase family protein [bacterium]|nr:beta-ketoacyl-[acyl-carrier-protein] synthase family protein [bacterium]